MPPRGLAGHNALELCRFHRLHSTVGVPRELAFLAELAGRLALAVLDLGSDQPEPDEALQHEGRELEPLVEGQRFERLRAHGVNTIVVPRPTRRAGTRG